MQPAGSRIAWAAMAAFALAMTTAAVAQPAAGDDSALPRCSKTVTDKCMEGAPAPKTWHKRKRHHHKAKATAPAKAAAAPAKPAAAPAKPAKPAAKGK